MIRKDFGARRDGQRASLVELRSPGGVVARVSDHGATLVSLEVPRDAGAPVDVVLGFDDVAGYESAAGHYLGATIGRVANRIAHGRFDLDGQTYRLACNEPPHHLHGGAERSFDRALWDLDDGDDSAVVLRHRSPDGEEGYPGTVDVSAHYRVDDDGLSITYLATVDRPTPVNLTNHAYVNLAGAGAGAVLDHELQVHADRVLEVDADKVPTGRELSVADSCFDLRRSTRLDGPVAALGPQGGLDHHYVCSSPHGALRPVAQLAEPTGGLVATLHSDQPGLQVYTGNSLPGVAGRGGARYRRHAGLCLEPQHAPDSLRHPEWPSIVADPSRPYRHEIRWSFTTA
jgi:aldose 1-epimerase